MGRSSPDHTSVLDAERRLFLRVRTGSRVWYRLHAQAGSADE